MLNAELRELYRSKLKVYYFNQQQFKDMNAVKRQVNNMDDKTLEESYNRAFEVEIVL